LICHFTPPESQPASNSGEARILGFQRRDHQVAAAEHAREDKGSDDPHFPLARHGLPFASAIALRFNPGCKHKTPVDAPAGAVRLTGVPVFNDDCLHDCSRPATPTVNLSAIGRTGFLIGR
jgi:hypothetical protein